MAYPLFDETGSVRTDATVKEAQTNLGEAYVYDEIHIQNQSATAVLKLKWGDDCSDTVYHYSIAVGTPPVVIKNVPASQKLTAYSSDLKYTYTIR